MQRRCIFSERLGSGLLPRKLHVDGVLHVQGGRVVTITAEAAAGPKSRRSSDAGSVAMSRKSSPAVQHSDACVIDIG
jgi:hypothetical protein